MEGNYRKQIQKIFDESMLWRVIKLWVTENFRMRFNEIISHCRLFPSPFMMTLRMISQRFYVTKHFCDASLRENTEMQCFSPKEGRYLH